MKIIKSFIFLILLSIVASCHNTVTTIGNYNLPTTVEKNPLKVGESCAKRILPFSLLLSNDNLTVEKARQSANIKDIISIEQEIRNIFALYYHKCVIVRGN